MPTEALLGALGFFVLFVVFVVLPSKLQRHTDDEELPISEPAAATD